MDYVLVAVFGLLVAAGELVSRYRDAPLRAFRTLSAAAYVAINVTAALSALVLIRIFGFTFGAEEPSEQKALQVLVAGFGAIAFFRTALFMVRVGGRDVSVGPVTLLHVLQFATDRDVDRRRAAQRQKIVTDALRGLTLSQVDPALSRYCLTLMQNVTAEERSELRDKLNDTRNAEMDETLKVNALGLDLMNVVGEKVLQAAANGVRTRILDKGVLGEVYPRLQEQIRQTSSPAEKVLDVLGLTLSATWPRIKFWLEEDDSLLTGWTVVLRILDPDLLEGIGRQWFDPNWVAEIRSVVSEIEELQADKARLENRGITVALRKYSLAPAIHGFRTGGCYFISFVQWDGKTGKIARPYQDYEVLPLEDASPRASDYKRLFDNWLQRIDASPDADSTDQTLTLP